MIVFYISILPVLQIQLDRRIYKYPIGDLETAASGPKVRQIVEPFD